MLDMKVSLVGLLLTREPRCASQQQLQTFSPGGTRSISLVRGQIQLTHVSRNYACIGILVYLESVNIRGSKGVLMGIIQRGRAASALPSHTCLVLYLCRVQSSKVWCYLSKNLWERNTHFQSLKTNLQRKSWNQLDASDLFGCLKEAVWCVAWDMYFRVRETSFQTPVVPFICYLIFGRPLYLLYSQILYLKVTYFPRLCGSRWCVYSS